MSESNPSLAFILLPFADILAFISTRTVSKYFPYPWATTIHAARISVGYQANVRRTASHHIPWATYIAGYLVMCFGGGVISNFLLSQPPPQLYSIHPYVNYISVHLALTAFFKAFPAALNPKLIDTILFPLDAIVRTNAITATLNMLGPKVNPLLTQSPVFHGILGAIASAGGGVSAATMSTWTPEWTLATPVFLRTGAGLWGTVDVWGGSIVAIIYSTLTGHPAFAEVTPYLKQYGALSDGKALSPLGAKSLAAAVLTVLFGARVYAAHWAPPTPMTPLRPAIKIDEKSKKKR